MIRVIQSCLMILGLLLLTKLALAAPPVPDGATVVARFGCSDLATREVGLCVVLVDAAGQTWVAFFQDNHIKLLRRMEGDGYVTVWTAPGFGTI